MINVVKAGSFDAPCLFVIYSIIGSQTILFFALLLQAFLLLFPVFELPSSLLPFKEGDYVGEECICR